MDQVVNWINSQKEDNFKPEPAMVRLRGFFSPVGNAKRRMDGSTSFSRSRFDEMLKWGWREIKYLAQIDLWVIMIAKLSKIKILQIILPPSPRHDSDGSRTFSHHLPSGALGLTLPIFGNINNSCCLDQWWFWGEIVLIARIFLARVSGK